MNNVYTENVELTYVNLDMQINPLPSASSIEKPKKSTHVIKHSKAPRVRTAFTNYQFTELEREFQQCIYLHQARRINIATRLGLNEIQVKVWFKNRRAKYKKSSVMANEPIEKLRIDHQIARRYTKSSRQAEMITGSVDASSSQSDMSSAKPQIISPALPYIPQQQAETVDPSHNTYQDNRNTKPQIISVEILAPAFSAFPQQQELQPELQPELQYQKQQQSFIWQFPHQHNQEAAPIFSY